MIGAGVFAALGPAARAAGSGIVVALLVAAAVAFANATSSAQLAALHPESGGTYVYGRERLGPYWGFIAGWGFVVGKTASCAAMALTFGVAVAPSAARPLGIAALVAVTAIDYRGVGKSAALTRAILVVVLGTLLLVVASGAGTGSRPAGDPTLLGTGGPAGILQAAGLLFFAFAGYARIATLGEEVRDPSRTIPRAIPVALAITLVVYLAVVVAALGSIGPDALASAEAPLREVVVGGPFDPLAPLVRVGAAAAALSVLSLLVGVSRTTFAMASRRELPSYLDAVHPRFRVPHRAELAVAAIAAVVVATVDVRGAIGFSSFAVLVYYGIANASAWTLSAEERRWPRWLCAGGLVGCVVLAAFLPGRSVVGGACVLGVGSALWWLRR